MLVLVGSAFHQMQRDLEVATRENGRLKKDVDDLRHQMQQINQTMMANAGMGTPMPGVPRNPAPAAKLNRCRVGLRCLAYRRVKGRPLTLRRRRSTTIIRRVDRQINLNPNGAGVHRDQGIRRLDIRANRTIQCRPQTLPAGWRPQEGETNMPIPPLFDWRRYAVAAC